MMRSLARFIWTIRRRPLLGGRPRRAANRAGGLVLRYALELLRRARSGPPPLPVGGPRRARAGEPTGMTLCTIYGFVAAMQDMQTRNHKLVKDKWRWWWTGPGKQLFFAP